MLHVRFDSGRMDAAKVNDKGYLQADAFATRAGVFTYILGDGTVRRELRPPEEVFSKDSMESLRDVVITNNHPPVALNSQNTRDYAAGWTGKDVRRAQKFLQVDTTITDAETIKDIIEGGKHELSCGYNCMIEHTSGEFEGERYDAIQRTIRYNHLSVVDRGRAGPDVKIKFDSAEQNSNFGVMRVDANDDFKKNSEKKDVQPEKNTVSSDKNPETKERRMTKITIDGVDYEVSETVATVVAAKLKESDKLKSDNDLLAKQNETLQGKCDGLESDVKTKNQKISELEKKDFSDDEIRKRATELNKVDSLAKKVIGEDFKADGKSLAEVKRAIVAKAKPELKLEGKSDGYVDGVFDSISESHNDAAGDPLKSALGQHTREAGNKRYDQDDARFSSMKNDLKHFDEYKGM